MVRRAGGPAEPRKPDMRTLLAFALLLSTLAAARAQPATPSVRSIAVGHQQREYILAPIGPPPAPDALLPAILVLPGLGTRITDPVIPRFDLPFAAVPGIPAALVATLQGANRTWDSIPASVDSYRRLSGLDGEQVDDIGFLRAVVAELVATRHADPARIYVAGVSAGGYMTVRVACEMPDVVAAVADIIATARAAQLKHCPPGRPVPVLLLASTTDSVNPYAGQGGPDWAALASAPATAAFFAARDGCTTRTETALPQRDAATSAALVRHTGCAAGTEVLFARIDGSDHAVPSPAPFERNSPEYAGMRNRDLDTATLVWSFFADHRR